MSIREIFRHAFLNSSDAFRLKFEQRDEAGVYQSFDFEPVTRITLQIGSQIIDESAGSNVIDWSFGGGVVKFSLGGQSLQAIKEGACVMRVYDAAHPNGQTLIYPDARSKNRLFVTLSE